MVIGTQRSEAAQNGSFLRQLLQNRRTLGGDFGRHNEVGDLRTKRHCYAAFAGGNSASRLGGQSLYGGRATVRRRTFSGYRTRGT